MNDINVINRLLENGVITQEEYDTINNRLNNSTSVITISDLLHGFDSWCESQNYSKYTKVGYKVEATALLKHLTNIYELSALKLIEFTGLTLKDVNDYILYTSETQTTGFSFRRTKYGLSAFVKYLNEMKYTNINIEKFISLDKFIVDKDKGNKIILSDEEIIKISNSNDLRSKVCILLCFEGILKRNELYTIRKDDFDFKNNTLTIYNNLNIENGIINNNFNNISRIVNISEELIKLVDIYINELEENIDHWNKYRVNMGRESREEYGFIFQSVKTPIPSFSIIHNIFKTNAIKFYSQLGLTDEDKEEKIKNFTIETVRNSRRVWLFKEGLDTNKIMLIAGDGNYHMCNKFKKFVSIIYPESLK